MKEIVKVKLKIAHADFTPDKEFLAEYDPFQDTYTATSNRNQKVVLNGNWVEPVFDVDYEATYKLEVTRIDNEYKSKIAAALEKYKKAKTAALLTEQKQKEDIKLAERKAAEKAASDKAAEDDYKAKQEAIDAANNAKQAELLAMQAEAIATAKKEIEDQIESDKKLVADREDEINRIKQELAQYESLVSVETEEEVKQEWLKKLANMETLEGTLVEAKNRLDLSKKQLESLDEVKP